MPKAVAVIYLHGFMSSEQAHKAKLCSDFLKQYYPSTVFHVPRLPDKPRQAIDFLDQYIAELQQHYCCCLIGSSLGGFYAQLFSAKYRCKSVLINPLVDASQRLMIYDESEVGQLQNPYTGEYFSIDVDDHDAVELATRVLPAPANQHLVLLQMADQVLDAQIASHYFQRASCIIEPAGDHQYQNLERYLSHVFAWLLAA